MSNLRQIMIIALLLLATTGCTKSQALSIASSTVEASVEANNALVGALQKINDRARLDREAAMIKIAQTATSKEQGRADIDLVDVEYAKAFELLADAQSAQSALAKALESARAAIDAGRQPDVDQLLVLGAELRSLHAAILMILAGLK